VFRHTDYFNRSISCSSGGNEGSGGVGAIHIPGTPTTNVNGTTSLMLACFNSGVDGEFTGSDRTALNFLY
ncbi:MAG: M57 family metalloprotease, partial [Bacteroidota bacterium]